MLRISRHGAGKKSNELFLGFHWEELPVKFSYYSVVAFICALGLWSCGESSQSEDRKATWLLTQSSMVGELHFHETDADDDYVAYLTVHASNHVLAFTDRPERETKFISNKEFASFWELDSRDSFSAVPPNAVLHFSLDQEHLYFDVPIVMVNGVYLEDTQLNTMVYEIQHDGTESLEAVWGKLKQSPLCVEKNNEPDTSRSCVIHNPVLFIDSLWDDLWSDVTTFTQPVSDAVVDTANSITDPDTRCVTGLTTTISVALAASGEEEEFDLAIIAARLLNEQAEAEAEERACETLAEAINLIDNRIDTETLATACGTLVRTAISPTVAVVHAASCLVCGQPISK